MYFPENLKIHYISNKLLSGKILVASSRLLFAPVQTQQKIIIQQTQTTKTQGEVETSRSALKHYSTVAITLLLGP